MNKKLIYKNNKKERTEKKEIMKDKRRKDYYKNIPSKIQYYYYSFPYSHYLNYLNLLFQ